MANVSSSEGLKIHSCLWFFCMSESPGSLKAVGTVFVFQMKLLFWACVHTVSWRVVPGIFVPGPMNNFNSMVPVACCCLRFHPGLKSCEGYTNHSSDVRGRKISNCTPPPAQWRAVIWQEIPFRKDNSIQDKDRPVSMESPVCSGFHCVWCRWIYWI